MHCSMQWQQNILSISEFFFFLLSILNFHLGISLCANSLPFCWSWAQTVFAYGVSSKLDYNTASPCCAVQLAAAFASQGPGTSGLRVTEQAVLSLLPHQLWSSLIQPAATQSLEGNLTGIPKQKRFLHLGWRFLFWTQGSLLSSCGILSKDHCLLYHLLDGAALGYHLPKSPFVQFYFKSGVLYIYKICSHKTTKSWV